MPNLVQLLRSQDLGYLRIVAELWGLDLKLDDVDSGSELMSRAMLDAPLVGEIIEALDPPGRSALSELLKASGRMPWAAFVRQFGDVREMGAGRRDRERPQVHPASAAEVLFYRALLSRAFFDTDRGPLEFGYVADDLLHLIQDQGPEPPARAALGRAAAPAERSRAFLASDRILDEATTLLAALRTQRPASEDRVLRGLLENAGIMRGGAPQAGKVKAFLEMSRGEALRLLVWAWRDSETFNELRLVPSLICEGEWRNQPQPARRFLLDQLQAVPPETWWSLTAFISAIKQQHADFQRPAGDYDSWFVKDAVDGSYLRGFSSWDQVDGALIRFLLTNVMHRLALLDLASPAEEKALSAFRLPGAGRSRADPAENGKLHITSQSRITAPRLVPRAVRYQLARFCEWDDEKADEYRYHVTPGSLTKAREQGLKVEHLLALLGRHSDAGIPPVTVKALKRWEQAGAEARTEMQVVLRVKRPEIIKELQRSKAARFLDQPLGPTAIIVKSGAQAKVIAALAELGILAQDDTVQMTEVLEDTGGLPKKSGAKLTSKR